MKVSLLSENLKKYIPLLSKVLPTHPQLPILGNVFISATTAGGLVIKATDLELGVEIKIPSKVEEEGKITVPGKEFLEVISSLPSDKIELSSDKDFLVLRSRGNKVRFNTISGDDFPVLYKKKGSKIASYSRKEFEDIFSNLVFSASTDEVRPQLSGIYINRRDGEIDHVSTDGYRMSLMTIDGSSKEGLSGGLIVSVRAVNEGLSLRESGDEVGFFVNPDESQALFECGDVVVVGRLIAGAYPDYMKVVPKESKTTVEIDRDELLQNVKTASVFARDQGNIVQMEVLEGMVKLTTKAAGVGEGEIVVDCETRGDPNKIAFNSRYLQEFLKTVKDKTVTLRLNDALKPALFELKGKKYVHVIMPVQVGD